MSERDEVDVERLGEAIAELQDQQLAERNDLATHARRIEALYRG